MAYDFPPRYVWQSLLSRYWIPSETASLEAKTANLTIEQKVKVEKDIAKKQAKDAAKADKAHQKQMASHVIIKRIERSKRKYVTAVNGLQAFDIDIKKLAKEFGKKVEEVKLI